MVFSIDKLQLQFKHKAVLVLIVILLAVWAVTSSVFLPQREELAALGEQHRMEQHQVQIIKAYAINHPDIDTHLAELDNRWALISKALPDNPGISEFLIELEAAANQSGVALVQVKPTQPVNKEGYQETQLEVLIRGSFFQVLNFVKQMEEGSRFSVITNITVHSQQGVLESKLAVQIYNTKH